MEEPAKAIRGNGSKCLGEIRIKKDDPRRNDNRHETPEQSNPEAQRDFGCRSCLRMSGGPALQCFAEWIELKIAHRSHVQRTTNIIFGDPEPDRKSYDFPIFAMA
ncbi:MAG: hypothetical protein ABSA13_08185 [Beijerinckiaceae bacterium]